MAGTVLLIKLNYSVLENFFILDEAENNNTWNRIFIILKAKNRNSTI